MVVVLCVIVLCVCVPALPADSTVEYTILGTRGISAIVLPLSKPCCSLHYILIPNLDLTSTIEYTILGTRGISVMVLPLSISLALAGSILKAEYL